MLDGNPINGRKKGSKKEAQANAIRFPPRLWSLQLTTYYILQNLSAKLTKVPLPKEQTGKVQACISTAFKAKRHELAGKENRIVNRRYGYLQSIRRDNDSTPSAQIQSILQLPRKKKRNPTLNLSGSGTPITMICQDEKLNSFITKTIAQRQMKIG